MKLFIYCFRPFDEKQSFDALCEKYQITYGYTEAYPTVENANLAQGYDAISITPTTIDAELIHLFKQIGVHAILNRSIGIDHIDIATAKSLGMHISNVRYAPESVADYTIMMMMMSLRKINFILDTAKLQDFTLQGKIGKSLSNCTVGVIGTGQIGKTVIHRLTGFGCKILAYDPYINSEIEGICEYTTLEELYEMSDVITLHIPASKENHHLINDQAFHKMKKTVTLVNTARGSLIDTNALIGALENKQIGSVALDVLEKEDELYYFDRKGENLSNRELALLRSFPHVLLTPHTAFYTEDVVSNMAKDTVDCFIDLMNSKSNKQLII